MKGEGESAVVATAWYLIEPGGDGVGVGALRKEEYDEVEGFATDGHVERRAGAVLVEATLVVVPLAPVAW